MEGAAVKTALITGAAGFVGRHMTRYLRDADWNVVGNDILWEPTQNIITGHSDARFDLVIHAAAVGPNRKAIDTAPSHFPHNVGLDAQMIEWVAKTQQPRFVYLSSSAIYPKTLQGLTGWRSTADPGFMGSRRLREHQDFEDLPFDSYGETKRIGEKMCAAASESGTKVTIVRPFTGYGTDQSEDFPFRAFLERARRMDDPFKIWGSAEQVRDWIHIDDICAGIMKLVDEEVTRPVNLCTGVGHSMRELAEMMMARAGYKGKIEVDVNEPLGVHFRVGDPTFMAYWYVPKITLDEGVDRAFRGV